jgi:hypothetical protein
MDSENASGDGTRVIGGCKDGTIGAMPRRTLSQGQSFERILKR